MQSYSRRDASSGAPEPALTCVGHACSELSIPWGGEFSIFSPAHTGNLTRCGHSCMRVTPTRLLSRKLTSLAMYGVLPHC